MKVMLSVIVAYAKVLSLVVLLTCMGKLAAVAQVAGYTFSSNNVVYSPITGGTLLGTPSNDDQSFNGIPIGFSFKFNCINYTEISISSNGYIVFGAAAPLTYQPISSGVASNLIAGLAMDLQGNGTSSELRTELIGTAPNRILVVQWKDYRYYANTGDAYNFQIRLNEGSNTIDLHYGAFSQNATNRNPQVGLCGANSLDFNNRQVIAGGSWAASTAGSSNAATCALQTALKPNSGQLFSFAVSPGAYISSSAFDYAPAGTALTCEQNCPLTRLEVVVGGSCGSIVTLDQVMVTITGSAPLSTISRVHLYHSGTNPLVSAPRTEIVAGGKAPASSLTFDGSVQLLSGTNYFWITMDFNGTASPGMTVGADMPNTNAITVAGIMRNPTATPNCLRTFVACPAYPTNPTLWMRASLGTNTTVNNVGVSSWASSGGSIPITVPQAMGNRRPLYKTGGGNTTDNRFNYNPYLLFDGVNDQLITTGTYNFGDGTASGTGLSTFAVMGWSSGVVAYEWNGPNATVKTKGDASCVITNGSGQPGSNNYALYPTSFQATVTDCIGRENGIEARCNAVNQDLFSNNNPSLITDKVAIGSNVNSGEFMNGGNAEWLIYNSMLSSTARLQVESYLAIKYGATLGSTSLPSNYLASNGVTTYLGDNIYQNNVIGIGRDVTANLLQKQSHNYDDSVRIYIGNLASTNLLNTATFAADNSFVIAGANRGAMCSTSATSAEMPGSCGLFSRLDREWKVTRTNMAESFSMDFTLNACATPAWVNPADLRLLIDDDGDFGNGGTTCYRNGDGSGIVISYSNPVITIANINSISHIPNNATRYISIGSVSNSTTLPVTLLAFETRCKADTVQLRWKTAPRSNEAYFVVERSVDARNFNVIARIEGDGSPSTVQNYVFGDTQFESTMSYYRLQMVATDGTMVHSDIIEVDRENCGPASAYVLYPNPANGDELHLSGTVSADENATLIIHNLLGQKVATMAVVFETGTFTIDLPIQDLTPGLYLLSIQTQGQTTQTLKFLRQ